MPSGVGGVHACAASRGAFQLRDFIAAVLEDVQQIVGQIDVALVQLVDEEDTRAFIGQESCAQRPQGDEVAQSGRLAAVSR